jgi:hypothetical protein
MFQNSRLSTCTQRSASIAVLDLAVIVSAMTEGLAALSSAEMPHICTTVDESESPLRECFSLSHSVHLRLLHRHVHIFEILFTFKKHVNLTSSPVMMG